MHDIWMLYFVEDVDFVIEVYFAILAAEVLLEIGFDGNFLMLFIFGSSDNRVCSFCKDRSNFILFFGIDVGIALMCSGIEMLIVLLFM